MLCSANAPYINRWFIIKTGNEGADSTYLRYESIMYFIFAVSLVFADVNTARSMFPNKNKKVNENLLYSIR
jgi:hypothetical protein